MCYEFLCRVYVTQQPLKELVGDPLFHRGRILLYVLQTSSKKHRQ